MILCEEGPPLLRSGEIDIGGRRAAAHAVPYAGEAGLPEFRFDPVERRFTRRTAGRVAAGPHDPEAWRAALARAPAGPVLVGPGSPCEEVRGSQRAAAEGALGAGRGVYLLDPPPEALPGDAGGACVSVFGWHPEWEPGEAAALSVGLGVPSGVLVPIVPGWTAEQSLLEDLAARAAAAGLCFVSPLVPLHDGEARRVLVEARGSGEDFFEFAHHLDWDAALPALLCAARAIVHRHGLSVMPSRPAGTADPPGNAAAAARMEERAHAAAEDEHRASLLLAAARWIDESGRDLAAIFSEGNFRKVFPFGPEIAREAEDVFVGRGG